MPIFAKCHCGKKLKVKDQLAGKRVKCPECGKSLLINPPDDDPAPAPKRPKAKKCPACGEELPASGVCLDCSLGLSTKKSAKKCSECDKLLPPGAMTCPNCGASRFEAEVRKGKKKFAKENAFLMGLVAFVTDQTWKKVLGEFIFAMILLSWLFFFSK